MHAIQRGTPAENLEFVNRLPAQERAEQTAQPENVIEMTMREQNAIQVFESQTRLQDLPLRAFAAIHQKAILVVLHHLRRKSALGRRGGGRCA